MKLPFIIERLNWPAKRERKDTELKHYCSICSNKIKVEKGYKTFQRPWEADTEIIKYICHRFDCRNTLSYARIRHGYTNVKEYASYDYLYY